MIGGSETLRFGNLLARGRCAGAATFLEKRLSLEESTNDAFSGKRFLLCGYEYSLSAREHAIVPPIRTFEHDFRIDQ
jgi:hypothetical protein